MVEHSLKTFSSEEEAPSLLFAFPFLNGKLSDVRIKIYLSIYLSIYLPIYLHTLIYMFLSQWEVS